MNLGVDGKHSNLACLNREKWKDLKWLAMTKVWSGYGISNSSPQLVTG
jgi:hypothetical protein